MRVLTRDREASGLGPSLVDWVLRRFRLTPARITAIYLVLGLSALYGSDVLLARYFSDPLLGRLQSIKGAAEVVVTAAVILGLTAAKQAQVDRSSEKIDRQREELLVLHRVLRHNLRNDLNVILGWSESLKASAAAEEDKRRCRAIWRSANKMRRYTEQAERIRKVTDRSGDLTSIDLGEALPDLVSRHPLVTDAVDVTVEVPGGVRVEANPMLLEAVEELVSNAIEHNPADAPRVEVVVDPDVGPRHLVEIRVSDDGPGVPEEVVGILESAEYDQRTHLQGMGLWFVYWAVAESEGRMSIDVGEDGGTTVRVKVPSASLVGAPPVEAVVG